jgi:hypothetical protein
MSTSKTWWMALGILLLSSSAWAQTSPVKVKVTRVSGAQTVLQSNTPLEVKLRISLQNLTNKALEGIKAHWTFVTEDNSYSPPRRQFHDGDKTVDLKSLAPFDFDSDMAEVSRNNFGVQLRGHWLQVSYQGKAIFEEFNPQTIKKFIEQHLKEPDKKEIGGEL